MGVMIFGLLITLTVFFNSIELSSQSDSPPRVWNPHEQNPTISFRPYSRMRLPSPYYYDDENSNGEIRARGHPNARPLIRKNLFIGMTDGAHYFPIIYGHSVSAINLLKQTINPMNDYEKDKIRQGAEAFIRVSQGGASTSQERRVAELFTSTWTPPIGEFSSRQNQ